VFTLPMNQVQGYLETGDINQLIPPPTEAAELQPLTEPFFLSRQVVEGSVPAQNGIPVGSVLDFYDQGFVYGSGIIADMELAGYMDENFQWVEGIKPITLTEGLPATPDKIVNVPAEMCTPDKMIAWAIAQDEKLPDFEAKVKEFKVLFPADGSWGALMPVLDVDKLASPKDYPVRYYLARCKDYYPTFYPEITKKLISESSGLPLDDALAMVAVYDTQFGRLATMMQTDWYMTEGTNGRTDNFYRMSYLLGEQRFEAAPMFGKEYALLVPRATPVRENSGDVFGSVAVRRVLTSENDNIMKTADTIDKMKIESSEDLLKMRELFGKQVFAAGACGMGEIFPPKP